MGVRSRMNICLQPEGRPRELMVGRLGGAPITKYTALVMSSVPVGQLQMRHPAQPVHCGKSL